MLVGCYPLSECMGITPVSVLGRKQALQISQGYVNFIYFMNIYAIHQWRDELMTTVVSVR